MSWQSLVKLACVQILSLLLLQAATMHVLQLYNIKIIQNGFEQLVPRRYREFDELHKQVRHCHPSCRTFDTPNSFATAGFSLPAILRRKEQSKSSNPARKKGQILRHPFDSEFCGLGDGRVVLHSGFGIWTKA